MKTKRLECEHPELDFIQDDVDDKRYYCLWCGNEVAL